MKDLIDISKGHFIRQLDGREPNAAGAAILEPLAEEPNTLRFWEQWQTKEDCDLHSAPNENLQAFIDLAGPLFAAPLGVIETPMEHFENKTSTAGTKYGIIAEFVVPAGKMEAFMELARGHFQRQHDGREPNATCASILTPEPERPNILRLVEQWETQADFDPGHSTHENLKLFLDTGTAEKLWESVSVKEFHMQHFVPSTVVE